MHEGLIMQPFGDIIVYPPIGLAFRPLITPPGTVLGSRAVLSER